MTELNIKYKKLHPKAKCPTKSHFEDAGWDLYSVSEVKVGPDPCKISTGIAVQIPQGYVGIIHDRSGLGSKGIKVHGGIVDSGYNGEIFVCLSFSGQEQQMGYKSLRMDAGHRIAQLVLHKIPLHVNWEEVEELGPTERSDGGFGSTGR
jgi:dUTP pyrophosphatase